MRSPSKFGQQRPVARRDLLRAGKEYVEECLENETPPHVNELARRLDLQADQLSKRFLREVGMHAGDYLKRRQIAHARRLLRTTTLSTTQIAYASGFRTRSAFFKAYRRLTSETPATFRRRKRARR